MSAPRFVTGDFIPVPAASVATAELDGETVLYLEATGEVHVLNPTAAVVFDAYDGHVSIDQVVDELAVAFETDPDIVGPGVMDVTRELLELGVLTDSAGSLAGSDAEPADAPDASYRYLRPPSI